ncbi:MAG: SGNH/GDSL hydrolase family protein [Clostridia bacterium]|nr:SGNH/GDSL hydrolase family protein [Clostridia bacterium]
MELKGLKINILGDSITEGVGVSEISKRYASVFEELSGAKVNNYGIGGTRIARQHKPSTKPRHDLCFLDRASEMEEGADVIIVFGGTNDFGHGDAAFGCFTDRDEYTFYGAMHSLVLRLKRRFPDAELVFMTPLHRATEDVPKADSGKVLKDYVDAMREVLEYYAIPTLDLYSVSGIQPRTEDDLDGMTVDGLHPNDRGARRIAERLYGFLKAL